MTSENELLTRLGEIEAEIDSLAEEKEMILHELRESRDDGPRNRRWADK